MAEAEFGTPERPASVMGVCLIYGFSIISMAFVGMIVPIVGMIAARLNTAPSEIGFAIALYSAPSALLAIVGGSIVDRIGTHLTILGGAALIVVADMFAYAATSLTIFNFAMLIGGIGFTGITIAAPALIIATTRDSFRTRAMSVWSTYAPTGFSLGLLIAAPFAGGTLWHIVPAVHGTLMLLLMASAALLPRARATAVNRGSARDQLFTFFGVFRNLRLMRLAFAIAVANGIAYGTSIAAPSYLARVDHVSMATSATTVAFAKILAMILAGLGMGELLSRRTNPFILYLIATAAGIAAQFVLFWPVSGFPVAATALGVWLLSYGCLASIGMALLPDLLQSMRQPGLGSGVVGQLTSLASFIAAQVYLGLDGWESFFTIAVAGLSIAVILLPARLQGRGLTEEIGAPMEPIVQ